MLNFWYSSMGIVMLIAGILFFADITNRRTKGERDKYGNQIEIYTAAIGMILIGLFLLIRELLKL